MDFYGPALPPGYLKPSEDDESDAECSSDLSKGSTSPKLIGPQRPSFLIEENEDDVSTNSCAVDICNVANSIGPQLPPHLQNSSTYEEENMLDKIWGPVPTQTREEINDISERKAAIDKRAEAMKDKLNNKNVPVKMNEREEWMIVPNISSRNQLGDISRCLAPSKSSSSSKDRHTHSHSSRNEKTTKELKQYNKSRRSESLLESHTKKLKKEEKKKSKSKEERKAFDRDEMAVRHFTKSQVNSVIEKAKYLNSRFAAGSNQYL